MEVLNIFPTLLLGVMIVLTLVLLPLIGDDERMSHQRIDEDPSPAKTDELRVIKRFK